MLGCARRHICCRSVQALCLISARSSSRLVARPKASPKHILDFTKVQDYLDHIASTRNTVTIADIERRRPAGHSTPGTPQYAQEYKNLLDTLVLSFSVKQLKEFVRLYGLDRPKNKGKQYYAMAIMEKQWNWPSLSTIEQRQRDWSELSSQTFPLDVRQSFLILGKDGADLLDLSMKYKVHITFSAHPMSLKVEGVIGYLKQLEEYMSNFKQDIFEEQISLPTRFSIRPDLLQRISRLTGAFLEDLGEGLVRISFKASDRRAFELARRLAIRASCHEPDEKAIFAHIPPGVATSSPVPLSMFPHNYSLYPFLSTRPLPWTVSAGGTFRVRHVGEWYSFTGSEDVDKTGGLANGKGRVLNLSEETCDIKELLGQTMSANGREISDVVASFGHALIVAPPSSRPSIVPPLKGHWPLSSIMRWINEHSVRNIFAPSLPVALLDSAPMQQRLLHRLIYRAVPPDQHARTWPRAELHPAEILCFELILSSPDSDHVVESGSDARLTSRLPQQSGFPSSFQFWTGLQTNLCLMLPDRPMDIHFTATDRVSIAQNEMPDELRKYFNQLHSYLHYAEPKAQQPETPLLLYFQDKVYILDSSSSVRQNIDSISWGPSHSTRAISESIVDLEGNQKSMICKVHCDDIKSGENWKLFLKSCDYLSTATNSANLQTTHRG